MITIITGVPGMGKTALVVAMMLEEQKKGWEGGERPFFVMGINDLTLDHSRVPPVVEWTELRPDPDDPTVMLPYYTFPPNSIIIIDEAQRVFRPRASGSKVPDSVAAQETHRHTGVDFWLLTQKPHLLDSNIRELAGRHIHIRNGFFGRWLNEWPEFTDVKSKANYSDAVKRKFRPPKAAFNKYKSAELHTKQPFRLHQVWIYLPLLLILFSYQVYKVYGNFQKKLHPETATSAPKSDNGLIPVKHSGVLNKPAPATFYRASDPVQPVAPATHPFTGYTFYIKGVLKGHGRELAYFDLIAPDGRNTFLSSDDLKDLGYEMKIASACSAFLFFRGAQIVATCSPTPQNGLAGAPQSAGLPVPSGDGAAPHVDLTASS